LSDLSYVRQAVRFSGIRPRRNRDKDHRFRAVSAERPDRLRPAPGPPAPTGYRRDLLPSASTARDEASVGRVPKGFRKSCGSASAKRPRYPEGCASSRSTGSGYTAGAVRSGGSASPKVRCNGHSTLGHPPESEPGERAPVSVRCRAGRGAGSRRSRGGRAGAPFEGRSGSTVHAVDVLHVTLAEPLHQLRGPTARCRRHQEMRRIGRQDVGVDANRLAFRERCRDARNPRSSLSATNIVIRSMLRGMPWHPCSMGGNVRVQ
jgi:hypothetical protein